MRSLFLFRFVHFSWCWSLQKEKSICSAIKWIAVRPHNRSHFGFSNYIFKFIKRTNGVNQINLRLFVMLRWFAVIVCTFIMLYSPLSEVSPHYFYNLAKFTSKIYSAKSSSKTAHIYRWKYHMKKLQVYCVIRNVTFRFTSFISYDVFIQNSPPKSLVLLSVMTFAAITFIANGWMELSAKFFDTPTVPAQYRTHAFQNV